MALCCTQIWWTTEVGIAFARVEEGYENALARMKAAGIDKVIEEYQKQLDAYLGK